MIVYVETNFLIELAYLQERCDHCREILKLSIESRITLALPAFSAAEARATLGRHATERRELQTKLKRHIREISRSQPFRTLTDESRVVVNALISGTEDSRSRLEETILQITENGRVIPLTAEVIQAARYYEITQSLSPQDALVLASITSDGLEHANEKMFVSQDANAFSAESVRAELSPEFKILTNFDDALSYIKARLAL